MTGIPSPPHPADARPGPGPDSRALVELVAARAMTLEEVLSGRPPGEGVAGFDAAGLLKRWSRIFAGGDRAALQRRLTWDGLDERLITAALEGPPTPAIPPHLHALPEILAEPVPQTLPPDEAEVPFAHLLAPWAQHARRRLAALVPGLPALVAPAALQEAERHLLEQLSAAATAALYQEFEAFRSSYYRSDAVVSGTLPGDHAYRAFVDSLRGPQLAAFLAAYPVLAVHLCLLSWQWTEGMAELVIRLANDLEALGQAFADGGVLGPVTALEMGLSDRHAGGRQVAALRFARGTEVIYKPRDVTLEKGWEELVVWLQREGLRCAPAAPRVLDRPGYGWVERVCSAEVSEGTDFARRAGALVFLAWLLGGIDLHEDNVIATAAGPAPVDAEALLQPLRTDLTGAAAHSILATGLLTFPIITAQGSLVDAGGLVAGARSPSPRQQWENVNTDAMRPVSRPSPARSPTNLPRTHGQPWRVTGRPAELEEGFLEAYRFCLAHRHRLLDPAGPLRRFSLAAPRMVFRPTESYVRLQRALLAPAYQRLGAERSIALDALNRVFATSPRRPPLWPLVAEERAALERLDIPRFTIPATAEALVAASGEVIPGVVKRSGWASLADRVQGLSEQQLAHHRHLLRVCAATQPLADEGVSAGEAELATALAAWREALRAAAVRCAEEIERTVFAGESRPRLALWGGLDPADLYHGLPGVALLFAALHRATGDPRWRSRARACWQAVLSQPDESPRSLGACEGWGGRMYALALLAALSDDADAAPAARRLLAAFPQQAMGGDARLDVHAGSAGAVLGLLAAFATLGEERAVALAQQCAEHLLAAQRPDGGWHPADSAAPGFAHGAAGIACALARLATVTGDARLAGAARRAFQFEFSLFDTRRKTFRTPARDPGGAVRHVSMSAWCNGAPGVALALATAGLPTSGLIGLEQALALTRDCGLAGLDHLCCGSLGIIDVLLTSGQRLGQESLIRAAIARGIVVLRRAMGSDTFALEEAAAPAVRLGLFHGLAGVGYQALRLAAPATYPSLLALLPVGNGQP